MTATRPLLLCAVLALAAAHAPAADAQANVQSRAGARVPPAAQADGPAERILAVVNGDAITTGDVTARGRLFALTTGMPVTQDVISRLRPQILKQLIDERLRLQEAQRRKVVVTDGEIAEAIGEIETRNNMPKGTLAGALQGRGVAMHTLIDQVRVQIGWSRVLREEIGAKSEIGDAEVEDARRSFKAQIGQPEFHLGEIFIPIDDPARAADAQRFAETVITELRGGAPFPVVAAQFSQSQTALQGGDIGWQRANQLDPAIAAVVREMPPGAVSNPIRVPGGISIVTLAGKRVAGQDQSTLVNLRQAFVPFTSPLNPQAPTEQQKKALEQAGAISKSARSCDDLAAVNERLGKARPSDPGEVRLESVGSPVLRGLISSLPIGQASKPLVSSDGIAVMMVCSREVKTASEPNKAELSNQLLNQRVEMTSRQMLRDLRRKSVIDMRDNVAQR